MTNNWKMAFQSQKVTNDEMESKLQKEFYLVIK